MSATCGKGLDFTSGRCLRSRCCSRTIGMLGGCSGILRALINLQALYEEDVENFQILEPPGTRVRPCLRWFRCKTMLEMVQVFNTRGMFQRKSFLEASKTFLSERNPLEVAKLHAGWRWVSAVRSSAESQALCFCE